MNSSTYLNLTATNFFWNQKNYKTANEDSPIRKAKMLS